MEFLDRIHPESNIDGFTKLDGTVIFYSFVRAIMLRNSATKVLDYGAGRGAFWHLNNDKTGSLYRRQLQDLRFGQAVVTACDIDDVVSSHPCSDRQVVLKRGDKLPFRSNEFDIIVSDATFEHIDNPECSAAELVRILRRGGVLCVRTSNKYGYVRLLAGVVPNSLHSLFLKHVQPDRKAEDIFPTRYKLNSVSDFRRYFKGCEIHYYRESSEPSYYFGSPVIYKSILVAHKLMPDIFGTSLCAFIKKS
jgi:SAM-dependent methyltransferase